MDPTTTLKLMMDPTSDMDERAVAATDLLVWLASGGHVPEGWTTHLTGLRTISDAKRAYATAIAGECKTFIFRALDRLAELETK